MTYFSPWFPLKAVNLFFRESTQSEIPVMCNCKVPHIYKDTLTKSCLKRDHLGLTNSLWKNCVRTLCECSPVPGVCFFPVCLLSCSHRAFHFWHFGHQMCGGFSPQQEASLHDTRWVSHNLNNSDTICPEMASDSRVRVQSYKIICPIPYHTHTHTHTHTSDASWKPKLSSGLLTTQL